MIICCIPPFVLKRFNEKNKKMIKGTRKHKNKVFQAQLLEAYISQLLGRQAKRLAFKKTSRAGLSQKFAVPDNDLSV